MSDEQEHPDEPLTAEFFSEGWIRREEICTRLGIGDDLLEVCLQWAIIESREPDPQDEDRGAFPWLIVHTDAALPRKWKKGF